MRRDGRRRFLFRLALALGKSVGELTSQIAASEIDEWAAFYRLEPFGDWRADFRAGLIAATLFNVNRGKDAKALGAFDFMPLIDRPPEAPADIEGLHAKMLAWLPPSKAAAPA